MSPSAFAKCVVVSYQNNKGIFNKKINAEELVPTTLSDLEKALYIFYVLQLDYAMRSQILYNGANKLSSDVKGFFTPKFISSLTDAELINYLTMYLHPRYVNEALRRYRANTDTLVAEFSGNPRNLFIGKNKVVDVLTELKKFRGFGPKIGNFFVRTMINVFNFNFLDIDLMLPPVDIHDVRIAYLLGYTDTDQMTPKNIAYVKKLWNRACVDAGVSWLVFDKALWLLGSEGKPKSSAEVINLIS